MAQDDNDFSDFARDLEASVATAEAEDRNLEQTLRGGGAPAKKVPAKKAASKAAPKEPSLETEIDDPFAAASEQLQPKKKAAKKKETEPEDDQYEETVDHSYDDAVEFPDLSKLNETDDNEETTGLEEPETEESETGDTEEVEGSDESEEQDEADPEGGSEEAVAFDLDKELKRIENLSTSDLRKMHLEHKARLHQAEIDRKDAQKLAEKAEREAERVRQEYRDKLTDIKPPNINEHEPYKKVIERYNDWRKRAIRRIHDGTARERLSQEEGALRGELARIQMLTGSDYDREYSRFEQRVKDQYGRHSDAVLDVIDKAAEFEIEAHEIRSTFEQESESHAVKYARERHTNSAKEMSKEILKTFSVPKEEIEKNPYAFPSFMSRLLEDKENGEKHLAILSKDIDAIHKALEGPAPPDLESFVSPADREAAKELYVQEVEKYRKHRQQDIPMLAATGLQALRYMPMLIAKLNKQEALLKGKKATPLPTKKPRDSGKKKNEDDPEGLGRELDAKIGALG